VPNIHVTPSNQITGVVPTQGTYTADRDLYEEQMARLKPSLLAEVIERASFERGDAAKFRKLAKAELALMLADFATGARINAAEAERINAERLAAADAVRAKILVIAEADGVELSPAGAMLEARGRALREAEEARLRRVHERAALIARTKANNERARAELLADKLGVIS
jgi:hypothetical protein